MLQSTGSQRVGHNWVTEEQAAPGSEDKGCVCLKEIGREMTPVKALSRRC